ncbi:MAG TPA: DUF5666 domain-containing protein [Terriglobales bacterium]|nr:DUF5666 domain-containing protein [Terriglobales bacterium]
MKKAALVIAALAIVLASGCSSGNLNQTTIGASPASVLINIGDAPNDEILVFQMGITAATLNGGSNPSVLAAPAQIEFVENAAGFQPFSLGTIPAGTYTGITLTVSTPVIVAVDPTTKAVTPLTVSLSSTTVSIPFNPALTINRAPQVISLDLDLANSVSISGTAATVTPVFAATTSPVAPLATQNDSNGEINNARGKVTALTSGGFTVQPPSAGQPLTFATNAATVFKDGITGLAQITPGMILTVEAISQTDGSLLARTVEAETTTTAGQVLEGVITTTTGAPVTTANLVTQSVIAANAATAPPAGNSVAVSLTAATTFSVESSTISGALPAFNASTFGPGQQVIVDNATQPATSTAAPADKVKLQEQELFGTVTLLSSGNFTLSVSNTSTFFSLTNASLVPVQTTTATQLRGITLVNNAVVRVRGLLFFNAGSYTMIASRITP